VPSCKLICNGVRLEGFKFSGERKFRKRSSVSIQGTDDLDSVCFLSYQQQQDERSRVAVATSVVMMYLTMGRVYE